GRPRPCESDRRRSRREGLGSRSSPRERSVSSLEDRVLVARARLDPSASRRADEVEERMAWRERGNAPTRLWCRLRELTAGNEPAASFADARDLAGADPPPHGCDRDAEDASRLFNGQERLRHRLTSITLASLVQFYRYGSAGGDAFRAPRREAPIRGRPRRP